MKTVNRKTDQGIIIMVDQKSDADIACPMQHCGRRPNHRNGRIGLTIALRAHIF